MLKDVDILGLAHSSSAMHGMLQRYLAQYCKEKSPLIELACGIENDAFETRLEVQLSLHWQK